MITDPNILILTIGGAAFLGISIWIITKGTKGWFSIDKHIEHTFGEIYINQKTGIKTTIKVQRIKTDSDNKSIVIDRETRSMNGYERTFTFLDKSEAETLASLLMLAANDI